MGQKHVLLVLFFVTCMGSVVLASDEINDIDGPVVQTATAAIRGKRVVVQHRQLGADFRGRVAVYTGIPYAESPVGDLRYARPVPKTIEGEFDASGDAVIGCMQHRIFMMFRGDDTLTVQEDCLYLDVYVPEPRRDSSAVMVWIHGGGYHYGAKSHPKSNPMPMAALRDVVVVTINYRIGLLGFLSTGDDEIPGNLGLLDQRQALLWVQENIAAFGGDPSRVTIFGESAGSGSVNSHLLSPMSAGLFSGAILQSGASTPTWSFMTQEVNNAFTFSFGKAMGCDVNTSNELVTCLRGTSADEIKQLLDEGMAQMLYGVAPVADGHFLPEDPMQLQADGLFNNASVMIGCMEEEGNIFAVPILLGREGHDKLTFNRSEFRDILALFAQVTDPLTLDMIEFVYSSPEQLTATEPNLVDVVTRFNGNRILLCPTFSTAQEIAAAGRPTYSYFMTHAPTYSVWGRNYTWLGATHAEDVPYVFGSAFLSDGDNADDWFLQGRLADDEVELALQIMTYWSNFAKTGDPNLASKDNQSVDSPFPTWPQFTNDHQAYKILSRTMENHEGALPNTKECYFHDSVLPKLTENAAEIARLKSLLEDAVDEDSKKSCEDPDGCPEN